MECTKEQIISEYKKLKLKLSRAPTSKEFYTKTGIKLYHAQKSFGSNTYTKIQQEAGDKPRKFAIEGRSKNEFFQAYGKVVRELKEIPTQADWKYRKEKPVVGSYRKVLGIKWGQMPLAFIDWAIDKPDWEDVVDICTNHCKNKNLFPENTKVSTGSYGYVYLMKANKKGWYKIGQTGSTGRRASQLSALDLYDRNYEHVLETTDPFGLENYWHRRFEAKKFSKNKKDFFEFTQDDIKAFKEFYVKKAVKG